VETILEILKERLESGNKVKLSGFGNFVIRNKDVRKGRNPKTGEEMEISARRVLTFKPSQKLKDYINGR
jgi:integration host factor subunit alpha